MIPCMEGERGGKMAYKNPGSLDFSLGQMGRFVCYCPNCHKKVVKLPEDFQQLKNDLRVSVDNYPKLGIKMRIKLWTKKHLTEYAEGL